MGNAGHYIGTEPQRALDSPVIVWVLLCRSTVCPYVQGRVEVLGEYPGAVEAKSVITTQVKIEC